MRMLACHGGLRPPLLVVPQRGHYRRNCDLCATRTLVYKSGGRQPAVVRVTHRQRRACLSERETRVARLACTRHSWSRERVPSLICVSDRRVCYVCYGRLTPTALGARRYVPSGNSAICAARTHMHKSGGRQPAVVRYRTGNGERVSPNGKLASHSWLTPDTPGRVNGYRC
jgi:hypothetical protein